MNVYVIPLPREGVDCGDFPQDGVGVLGRHKVTLYTPSVCYADSSLTEGALEQQHPKASLWREVAALAVGGRLLRVAQGYPLQLGQPRHPAKFAVFANLCGIPLPV